MAARATLGVSVVTVSTKCRVFLGVVGLVTAVGCGGDSPTSPGAPPTPDTPNPTSSIGTLTGFVRETAPTETVPVPGARVEVVDPASGLLTGKFVLTDSRGSYQFPGLSGAVSFRASKDGYEGDSKRVQLTQTSTLDFSLMPSSRKPPRETIVLGQTHTGAVGNSDATCAGKFFVRPCKRFALGVTSQESLRARLAWSGGHDLDLELWRDDTFVAASLTCQACGVGSSDETFTATLSPGEYEVRAVLFQGIGAVIPFELTVSRAN